MFTRYDDFTAEESRMCDQAIDRAISYHNAFDGVEDEEDKYHVSRGNLFEYNSSPVIISDTILPVFEDHRIVVYKMDFFHDEGGPAEMCCFFQSTWEYDEADGTRHESGWTLNESMWAFDTEIWLMTRGSWTDMREAQGKWGWGG